MRVAHSPLSIRYAFAGAVVALAPLATAQIDVAICAAAGSSPTSCQFADPQAKLMATGAFNTVDIINVATATPTLAQLQAYDAVICWTNVTPASTSAWGDVLADYVDAGGGVVVTVFANSSTTANRNIGGRWQLGYEVIMDQSGNQSGNASLGTVSIPAHPVMQGVNTLIGGSAMYRPVGTALESGATLIASWTDGKVLVAEGANPRRVDLGMYPPSADCSTSYWSTASDGATLMKNALLYVAGGTCSGNIASYCTAGTTTNGCVPSLTASGTPSAAATAGFTLDCGTVEGAQNGMIFYGISGPLASPWGLGSTSFLCVKSPLERTGVQNSGGTPGACDGAFSVDFLAFLTANPGVLGTPASAGQQFHAQCWFRDPPAVKTTNLSDGVQWVLCP